MFHKNRGTPKWMVYSGKPYFLIGWFLGENPLFSKHPYIPDPSRRILGMCKDATCMMHGTFGEHRTFIFAKCEGMGICQNFQKELRSVNHQPTKNKKRAMKNGPPVVLDIYRVILPFITGFIISHSGNLYSISSIMESNKKFSWLTCINVRYQRSIFIDLAHKN